jgi:hypothetical protein
MGTCAPLSSSAGVAAPQHTRQAQPRLPGAHGAQHAVPGGGGLGRTVDGSLPASTRGEAVRGEHTSRWRYDWELGWVLRGCQEVAPPQGPSDKHQLAARRWGDGRDALGAAASSQAQRVDAPPRVPAGGASPPKRARLRPGAMSGQSSDGGFAAVGGLHRQKDALMAALVHPLAYPRLFAALGASSARGVLLHGPPGEGRLGVRSRWREVEGGGLGGLARRALPAAAGMPLACRPGWHPTRMRAPPRRPGAGSGKSHLARALAAEARLPLVQLCGGECAGEAGEAALRRAFAAARSQAPCILFLVRGRRRCALLALARGRGPASPGRRAQHSDGQEPVRQPPPSPAQPGAALFAGRGGCSGARPRPRRHAG